MLVVASDYSVAEIKVGGNTTGRHFHAVVLFPEDFANPDFVRFMSESVRARMLYPKPADNLTVAQRDARESLGSAIRSYTQPEVPQSK